MTDSEINIGVLTDLSGPFAAGAAVQVTEFQAYWDKVNADGGICDRDVKLQVQDHGYDPQKAVSLYRSMAPNIVALQQVLGGPTSAAVLPLAQQDSVYVGGVGWASSALQYENNQLPGASYSIEAANAVDYLVDELGLAKGDKIGVVYFVGDYGSDALAGAQYAAKERGLTDRPAGDHPGGHRPLRPGLGAGPGGRQGRPAGRGARTAGVARGGPRLAGRRRADHRDEPDIQPGAAQDARRGRPAGQHLQHHQRRARTRPTAPGVKAANDMYAEADPQGAIGWEVPLAYGQAELLKTALQDACDAGDLTPEGVVSALGSASGVDTDGVFPDGLDFTKTGESPTRTVFISKVDGSADAGLKLLDTIEGPSAKSYTFG